jgi:two-component system, cell cycle sensor histidine kinase and response regulator CckA
VPTADDVALRISIDHLLEGVQVIGFDWRYLYLNQTAMTHGQQPSESLLGRRMSDCYPGIEQTPMFAALQRVMRTRTAERLLNEFTCPDGQTRFFELRIDPVPDGICVLSLDVTERRSTEQLLQQAQKMEAIGQLAGGVVHDFNNLVTVILGYAELITEQIGPDKPIGRDVQEIVAAAERASALTHQLLAFSRKQGVEPTTVALNRVVAGVEPMLRRLISENIDIRTRLDPGVHAVVADAVQLEQVVLNLVVNARDAMVDGGQLTISTSNAVVDEFAQEHIDAPLGDYAVLSVRDTGIGMNRDVQSRIFEPFYTTKDRGRGTGLGLAAVRGIVKDLGGAIWVYSEPGCGTVFKIFLPKSEQPAEERRTAPRTGHAVGHERILVVEDEPGVRTFIRTILERHGYAVIEAGSGEAALAEIARPDQPVDLLLTDVVLSGIDGSRLADRIGRQHTNVRVLFMSGYADPLNAPLQQGRTLIEKPFSANVLLARVRDALDQSLPAA